MFEKSVINAHLSFVSFTGSVSGRSSTTGDETLLSDWNHHQEDAVGEGVCKRFPVKRPAEWVDIDWE